VVKLIAQHPFQDTLPVTIGSIEMSAVVPRVITSIAPLDGKTAQVSAALNETVLMAFPEAGRVLRSEAGRLMWAGHGMALLVDADAPDLTGLAAVTDQTDAWAIVQLQGAAVEDVLARLIPVDLRRDTFKVGHTARTMIGHMTGSVTRVGPDAFEVMVMRSMAGTLLHDLTRAAKGVAAR